MIAQPANRYPARAFLAPARAALLIAVVLSLSSFAPAQTSLSTNYKLTEEMKAKLVKEGDLTLRDANFVEGLLSIGKLWGINIIVGNDLKGETVSCQFEDAPLFEILDTLLVPRGYAYRPVGNSLVIGKQDSVSGLKPLFQTLTIKVASADANEVKDAVNVYLSEHGQIQSIPSAKLLNVIDFPDRLEMIQRKVEELDEAAKEINDEAKQAAADAAQLERERQQALAEQQANSAAGGGILGSLPTAPSKSAVFKLSYVKAENVALSLQSLLNAQGKISIISKDNRLIVVDTEDKLKLMTEMIHQIDVPRRQVRIDALIFDASLEDVRHCGVNWSSGVHGTSVDAAGVAKDVLTLGSLTAVNPAASAANGALTVASAGTHLTLKTVINSLAQSKDSRLLSDPSVTVYDQEIAKFDAVTEIPFQQLTQGLGGGSIGTTAFREAGTTLNVTPQIAEDQTITMLVNPKFSILAGLTATNQPIIDRREASTTVRARNGETVVIGGLRQRSAIKNMSGIPYLKDIKFVGPLFRDKQATVRESELIVFITPTIVDMGDIGTPRQEVIYNSSVPELESIPYPKLPSYPCPPDQWPHRCGLCKKCNKIHCGACEAAVDASAVAPSQAVPFQGRPAEQLPPPAPTPVPLKESAPTPSPAASTDDPIKTATRRLPTVPAESSPSPARKNVPSTAPEARFAPKTKTSSLPPGSAKPAASYLPVRRDIAKTQEFTPRSAASQPASKPALRPVSIVPSSMPAAGEVRRLEPVESPVAATSGMTSVKKLSPTRPVHVSQQPAGTKVR